jgi:hypothetical protein
MLQDSQQAASQAAKGSADLGYEAAVALFVTVPHAIAVAPLCWAKLWQPHVLAAWDPRHDPAHLA